MSGSKATGASASNTTDKAKGATVKAKADKAGLMPTHKYIMAQVTSTPDVLASVPAAHKHATIVMPRSKDGKVAEMNGDAKASIAYSKAAARAWAEMMPPAVKEAHALQRPRIYCGEDFVNDQLLFWLKQGIESKPGKTIRSVVLVHDEPGLCVIDGILSTIPKLVQFKVLSARRRRHKATAAAKKVKSLLAKRKRTEG